MFIYKDEKKFKLTNSCISHDKTLSVNKLLREYDEMKEEIKNLKTLTVHQIF